MVRRLTGDVTLSEFFGRLGSETANELEAIVESRRERREETHRDRVADVAEDLDE